MVEFSNWQPRVPASRLHIKNCRFVSAPNHPPIRSRRTGMSEGPGPAVPALAKWGTRSRFSAYRHLVPRPQLLRFERDNSDA